MALITDLGCGIEEAVSRAFTKHGASRITGQVIAVNGGAFIG